MLVGSHTVVGHFIILVGSLFFCWTKNLLTPLFDPGDVVHVVHAVHVASQQKSRSLAAKVFLTALVVLVIFSVPMLAMPTIQSTEHKALQPG